MQYLIAVRFFYKLQKIIFISFLVKINLVTQQVIIAHPQEHIIFSHKGLASLENLQVESQLNQTSALKTLKPTKKLN